MICAHNHKLAPNADTEGQPWQEKERAISGGMSMVYIPCKQLNLTKSDRNTWNGKYYTCCDAYSSEHTEVYEGTIIDVS